jgi:hypothetical protein
MYRTIPCALILALVGCGGGGNGSTGPDPSGATGTFTAVIDGQSWVSTTNQTTGAGSSQIPGLVTLTGTKIAGATDYTSISLALGYVAGTGTYPLGVNQGTTAGGGATVTTVQGTAFSVWSTQFPGDAGTVTVTSLTDTRIKGTFQFNAKAQTTSSATGTKVVTTGTFDLPVPSGFVAAPLGNRGSKVTATLGGSAWNAATIVALGSGNVFGFSATNDSYSINLTPGTPVTAGATYPIGPGAGAVSMIVSRTGTANSWTTGTSGTVGSMTIATFAGGRATGTFTATLIPGAGTSGSLVITGGTFDVKIN